MWSVGGLQHKIGCISLQIYCTPANAASHYFSLLLPLLPLPLPSLSSGLQWDLNLYEPVNRIVENVSYAVLILGELEDSQCLATVHTGLPSALCEHYMLLLRKKLNGVETFFGSSWPISCSRNFPPPPTFHKIGTFFFAKNYSVPGYDAVCFCIMSQDVVNLIFYENLRFCS